MAVQQTHQSRSRRDKRRTHDALTANLLSVDKTSGEVHIRHNMTAGGYYRGVKYDLEAAAPLSRKRK